MVCPNCGAEQPESFECVRCGIIFAKWAEHQARSRDMRAGQGRWLSREIGVTSRVLRGVAGVGLLVLSVLMYLNGSALHAFGPYIALVSFAAGGLYLLVSIRERIRMWRFMAEAAVTVAVSGVLFLALPDIFSLRKPLYTSSAPMTSGETRAFLEAARAHVAMMNQFMDTAAFKDTDEAVQVARGLSDDAVVRLWSAVPGHDRDLIAPIWYRLQGLKPLLAALVKQFPAELPKGPAAWVPAAIAQEFRVQAANVLAEVEAADMRLRDRDRAVMAAGTTSLSP